MVVSISIFLMTGNVEQLFICLLASYVFLLYVLVLKLGGGDMVLILLLFLKCIYILSIL